MKKRFYPLIMAIALAATACNKATEDSTETVDPSGKTAIAFSVEESHTPMTRAGFDKATKIAMRIKSTNGTSTKYTRTVASASATTGDFSSVTIADDDKRYWDDAFGRNAQLSVYAIAVPGANDASFENYLAAGSGTWFEETTENETLTWQVSSSQTPETLAAEDLTYSYNIQNGGEKGVYHYDFDNDDYSTTLSGGCMKFTQKPNAKTDDPGKFDRGHLIFNHALSRITVNLERGAGFENAAFGFTSGTVKVLNVPISGTLDLKDGSWKNVTNGDITSMVSQTAETGFDYKLVAQMLPDYVISSTANSTNVLTFIIDNNQYNVTQAQMFKALKDASGMTKKTDTDITMEQGLNYVFNIKVNKTGVSITASVAEFTPITAKDQEITNDNVNLTLHSVSGDPSTVFDLYRSEITSGYDKQNWGGNYIKHEGSLTNNGGTWKTNWFFGGNNTYYHFRTVKSGTHVESKDGETDVDDYFIIDAGDINTNDYRWGAPMKSTPVYKIENGYSDCLSLAIGPTSSTIAIAEMHVMSKIIIKLVTTSGNDAVTLAGSKITITQLFGKGNVLMGSGKVSWTGEPTATNPMTSNAAGTEFTYAVVPQLVSRGTGENDNVYITIETGDGNKYTIKNLNSILDSNKTAITRWMPGHSYTYSFTLKKTGIDNINATEQKWVEVTAGNQEVTL